MVNRYITHYCQSSGFTLLSNSLLPTLVVVLQLLGCSLCSWSWNITVMKFNNRLTFIRHHLNVQFSCSIIHILTPKWLRNSENFQTLRRKCTQDKTYLVWNVFLHHRMRLKWYFKKKTPFISLRSLLGPGVSHCRCHLHQDTCDRDWCGSLVSKWYEVRSNLWLPHLWSNYNYSLYNILQVVLLDNFFCHN